MASVSGSAQQPAHPPKPFHRKARASSRDPTASACISKSANTSDLCEPNMPVPSESCPRLHNGRAQYNRIVGEMVREEAQPFFDNFLSMESDKFEDLFLELSSNYEK